MEFLKRISVDLVIIDMMMAPGMNGRRTCLEIVGFRPGQRALIASDFSENEDIRATLKAGADGFINKPYTKKQLGRMLAKVFGKPEIEPDRIN